MLAGAYPSDEFAELKPRIIWDRVTDVVEGRRDARVVAVTSGGTIPDRGLFGVFLVGEAGTPGRRVGELDEEMVYESRAGEVITLGASSLADRGDRPRPGHRHARARRARQAAVLARRRASAGRSSSGGRSARSSARSRPTSTGAPAGARRRLDRLRRDHDLDELAAENLVAYLEDEREVAGALPTDRRIVVERFRDELGDWRLVLLTPFGGRVHAPWSLALEARLGERLGRRGPDDLVRRRDRDPAARRRGDARRRRRAAVPGSRGGRGPRRRRRSRLGAVRVAVPRERGAGAAAAAPPARARGRRSGSSASGPPTCWRSPVRYG